MIERGLMQHRRLGGRIVLIRSELEAWLASLEGCSPGEAIENMQKRHYGSV
jgi:hypothetical protein